MEKSFDDLRDFIDFLEKQKDLVRVKRAVDPKYEIASDIKDTFSTQGPALLFENVKGYDMPVVGGIFSTRKRLLWSLNSREEEVRNKIREGIKNPKPTKLVSEAPCQEVVLKGEEIDLSKLPIPTNFRKELGPSIEAGVQISKDPETGAKNAGIYRMPFYGEKNYLIVCPPVPQHLGVHILKAEEKSKPLEMAVAIGVDPAIIFAAQIKAPYGVDELGIAGALKGKPIEVVKCKTVDLEVPAKAEIIIEGKVLPGVRKKFGPRGELAGYYASPTNSPVFEVTAITHRKDPIFHTILVTTEERIIAQIMEEASFFEDLKNIFPDVQDVHFPTFGASEFMAIISIKQTYEGEARNIILNSFGNPKHHPKYVIVVDDDIDVRDLEKVFWAVVFRAQPNEDAIIIPNIAGGVFHDPSTLGRATYSVMGIDATRPYGVPFQEAVE